MLKEKKKINSSLEKKQQQLSVFKEAEANLHGSAVVFILNLP